MGEGDQGLKLTVIRQICSGDTVYGMVTIINNTVYTKFANIYVKSFHHNKNIYNNVRLTDINQTYCGDHFIAYTNIKS